MLLTNQLDAERLHADGSQCPMASTVAWLKGVIAKPHPQLGRSGSVCPFVPRAMQLSVLFLSFFQVGHAAKRTITPIATIATAHAPAVAIFLICFLLFFAGGSRMSSVIRASLKPSVNASTS